MEKVTFKKDMIRFMANMTGKDLKTLTSAILSLMDGGVVEDGLPFTVMTVVNELRKGADDSKRKSEWYADRKSRGVAVKKPVTPIPSTQTSVQPFVASRYPTSVEQVLEIAKNECQRMTQEEAEMYLANRQSLGWRNNNGQQIMNVRADVKMWAMRANNDKRQQQFGNKKQQQQDFTKHVSQDYSVGIL